MTGRVGERLGAGVSWGRLGAAPGLVVLLSACSGFGGASDQLPPSSGEQEVLAARAAEDGAAEDGAAEDVAEGAGAPEASNPAAADWSCLGAPPAATPGINGTGRVRYSAPIRNLFGVQPGNFVVRACEAADLSCASPVFEAQGLTPEGLMEVQVPIGFAGFLEMQADGQAPGVFYMRQPVYRDTVDLQPILTIPAAGIPQLAGLLNLELVPDLALLFIAVVDCRGERAPGVAFGNSLGGREFYFADGLPNVTVDATDIQGQGGFVNVPPRLLEVSAELAVDGRPIGTRIVLPRVGWIVGVTVRPPALPLE